MTIPAIPAISALSGLSATSNPALSAGSTSSAAGVSGTDFSSVLGKSIDNVQAVQNKADSLAVQAATGDLTDISSYTVAATQASLVTQLVSTVRSTAVSSFNEIMGMQA
jgi:flagellar hook-basal body complex protein FliE